MQSKDIVIGTIYAVRHIGKMVPMRATSVVSTRGRTSVSSTVEGFVDHADGTQTKLVVPVKDITETFEEHEKARKAHEAVMKAREDAEVALNRRRFRIVSKLAEHGVKVERPYGMRHRNDPEEADQHNRAIEIPDESLPELEKLLGLNNN